MRVGTYGHTNWGEVVGSGGFGTVYHAYQDFINREVAVKVIRHKYANQPQFIRRFETEARIIARLEHPHIVPLYDYWRDLKGAISHYALVTRRQSAR